MYSSNSKSAPSTDIVDKPMPIVPLIHTDNQKAPIYQRRHKIQHDQ